MAGEYTVRLEASSTGYIAAVYRPGASAPMEYLWALTRRGARRRADRYIARAKKADTDG